MSKHREQIIAALGPKIDEDVLGAAFAKPRGATTAIAGTDMISREIGARWTGRQSRGAEAAGLELANPGAVALTPQNLLLLAVKVSLTGQIKDVTDVVGTIPLAEVESLEVTRMGLAGVMEVRAAGAAFKLEGKAGDMKELAEAFARAKASI
jgi:hypothetical protein